MFKICGRCNIEQSYEYFHTDRNHSTGKTTICKSCKSEDYQQNKKARNLKNKEYKVRTNYVKNRRKNDDIFRISQNLRARVSRMIKRNKSEISAIKDLGCSLDQLKFYIESKFQQGMSWENYGKWQIDHVYPLSLAKDTVELAKLCHYTNLQPLWKSDNLKKYNKVA